ncbi:hypothetical protein BJX70DRAFT_371349 [Aspergillus crustosus]
MLSLLLLSPLLAGQSIAANPPTSLLKRHHDDENSAFVPAATDGCPNNWPVCGSSGVCYNPDEGQTCCPDGSYACPASSFCFQAPYCCPDSFTPELCAVEYKIELSGTDTATSTASHLSDAQETWVPFPPPPTSLDSGDDDDDDDEESSYASSGYSITITSTPLPTAASSLIPWPSVTLSATGGGPSSTVEEDQPTFTGGVAGWEVAGGEVVWGVVAALGVQLL